MACCQVNLKRRQPIHFHRFPQLPNFNKRRKRTKPLLPGSLNGRTSCAFFRLFPGPGRSNFILFYIFFIGPESQCCLPLQFFCQGPWEAAQLGPHGVSRGGDMRHLGAAQGFWGAAIFYCFLQVSYLLPTSTIQIILGWKIWEVAAPWNPCHCKTPRCPLLPPLEVLATRLEVPGAPPHKVPGHDFWDQNFQGCMFFMPLRKKTCSTTSYYCPKY